jgi:hypothetical protein
MHGRWIELFEDENKKLSSRTLLMLISVGTFCVCLVISLWRENPSESIIATFCTAIVALVGGVVTANKFVDGSVAKTVASAGSPASTVTNANTVNVTKEAKNG